jgi:hypothetical protein
MSEKRPWWHVSRPMACLAITLMLPAAWFAMVSGLEYAGEKNAALGVGWITIPFVMLAVPLGFVLTVVLAVMDRRKK